MRRAFLRECQKTIERIAVGMSGPVEPEERYALALDLLVRLLFLRLAGEAMPLGKRLYRTNLLPQLYGDGGIQLGKAHQVLRELFDVPENLGRNALSVDIDDTLLSPVLGEGGLLDGRLFQVDQPVHPAADHGTLAALVEYLGGDRRGRGAYYTPADVVDYICRQVLAQAINPVSALDPACGGGAFLVGMYQTTRQISTTGLASIALYGMDLDPRAVGVTRLRLWLESRNGGDRALDVEELKNRVQVGDALANAVRIDGRTAWDIIVTNPPYGTKVPGAVRDRLFDPRTDGPQSRDAYGLFVARSLELLTENGIAGLVIPETWRTIRSHLPLRRRVLAESRVTTVVELPQGTFDATVGSEIVVLQKGVPGEDHCIRAVDGLGAMPPPPLHSVTLDERLAAGDISTYCYPQALCTRDPNHPIFVGSPDLFRLMVEPGVVRLGMVAEVKHGLTTGATKRFVYSLAGVPGGYRAADPALVVSADELRGMSDDEKQHGFDPGRFDGKYLVPYDKGGGSRIVEGWLPCYWAPTEYYIDWRESSVAAMKKLPGFRHDGRRFYFRPGVTFSHTGQYAPTFRLGSASVFDTAGSSLFSDQIDLRLLLAILNSAVVRYLFRVFINNSVNVAENPLKELPLPHVRSEQAVRLTELVDSIIARQRIDRYYPFRRHEQPEIDRIVGDLYGLTNVDRLEIERWHARRYPRLYGT